MKALPTAGWAVSVVLIGLLWWSHRADRATLLELQHQIRALQSEQANRIAPDEPRAASPVVGVPLAPPRFAAPIDGAPDASVATAEPRQETEPSPEVALATRLTSAFTNDATDGWSPGAEQVLRSKLAASLPASSTARSISCRSTMCRIEVEVADDGQFRQFMRDTMMSPRAHPWNGAMAYYPVEPGRPGDPATTVVYLMREGQSLPADESTN